jgi:heptosyltransferase III
LQPSELRAAAAALAPMQDCDFIALSLGGKDAAKDWGNVNWVALLQSMSRRLARIGLVFIGSADEFWRCAAIAAEWPGPTLNLCGRITVRESAAAMRRAKFFLGHDCGPMHLAAAVGTPCVALFGPVNMPKWWHPIGAHHRVIHNRHNVRNIAPDEVLGAVDAVISAIADGAGGRNAAVTA